MNLAEKKKKLSAKFLHNQTDISIPIQETPWRGYPHTGDWREILTLQYNTTWHKESVAQHLFRADCALNVISFINLFKM